MKNGMDRREFLAGATALAAAPNLAATGLAGPTIISTIIGTGVLGDAPDGTAQTAAALNNPLGVIIGPDQRMYWTEYGGHRILALDFKTQKLSVIAGTGVKGHAGDGGPAKAAQLGTPHEVRFDSKGALYIAERDSHVVRKVDMKTGIISTYAGTAEKGFSGDGGPAAKAQLNQPHSIVIDAQDNLYICDIANHRIRKVDAKTGVIATFAGTGEAKDLEDNAPLEGTPLKGPRSIDLGQDGLMYLVLREGNKVLAIDLAAKRIRRVAGTGATGYSGDGGKALDATLGGPKGVTYSADGGLYIGDTENHVIRRIDLRRGTIATVAGTGKKGDGPDGLPTNCQLARPHGVFAVGHQVYIGDTDNNRIRLLRT